MKKILFALIALLAVFAFISCGSSKDDSQAAAGGKYVINEADEILAIYDFEDPIDDGDIPDASGNENTGFTSGVAAYVEGKNGNGMSFDGAGDYIMVDEDLIDVDELTVCMWIKPDGWRDWARVLDFGDAGATDIWLGYAPVERQLRFDAFGNGQAITILGQTPASGKWTHVAITIGDGFARLYMNGRMNGQMPIKLKPSDLLRKGVFIGRSNWPDPLFTGVMDDIVIAGSILNRKTINAIMNGIEK